MKEVDNQNVINDNPQGVDVEFENASPAKKVTLILNGIKIRTQDISDAKYIATDYEQLYSDANKENATKEAKKVFAAKAVLMHNSLKNFMAKTKADNPNELKRNPDVANINAAYAINSHATVKALESAGGDVFDALIREAYDDVADYNEPVEENQKPYEDKMAKLMYLSYLKYEYDHVSGNEDEKNAWRSEILTELISDKFEDNVQKFKTNPYYRDVMTKHIRLYNQYKSGDLRREDYPGINDTIYQAFHDSADEKYQDIYPLVHNGIEFWDEKKKAADTKKVTDAANDIDMMKALCINVIQGSKGYIPNKVVNDPAFDTLYIKRHSAVNGHYTNVPKGLFEDREFEAKKEDALKRRKKSLRDDVDKDIRNTKEAIDNNDDYIFERVEELYALPTKIEEFNTIIESETHALQLIENDYWRYFEMDYNKNHKVPLNDITRGPVFEAEKKRIEEEFWKKYKADYKREHKKSISSEELKEAKRKQGKIPVNEDAAVQLEIIKTHSASREMLIERKATVTGELLDKGKTPNEIDYMLSQMKNYKKLVAERKQKYAHKDEIATADINQEFEELRKAPVYTKNEVIQEGEAYQEAVKENNIETIKKIKAAREERDNKLKKADRDLFKVVEYKNLPAYISNDTETALTNIQNSFDRYNLKYKDYNESKDSPNRKININNVYKTSISEFKTFDERNTKIPTIARPDRSQQKVLKFDVEVLPAMAIDELDMDKVVIDQHLLEPEEIDLEVNEPVADNNSVQRILDAYNAVKKESFTFRTGSTEYKDIYEGLKSIRGAELQGENAIKKTIPNIMKIIAVMDQYIDRKEDEKDAAEGEKRNSRNRREAVIDARNSLRQALAGIKSQNGIYPKDFTPDEVRYSLEYLLKLNEKELKNSQNEKEVKSIISSLKKGDRIGSQKKMQEFLSKHVDSYMDPQTGYSFKVHDEDVNKKRIPENLDERIYAMMLKEYEKLVQSNILYYQYKNISRFPDLIDSVKNVNHENEIDKSINDKFGINIDTVDFSPKYRLKKVDNINDYKAQFDEHYKCCISTIANETYATSVVNKEHDMDYVVRAAILARTVESAFSSLYLQAVEKNMNNDNFNFDTVDQNRRKVLTVIKDTPIVDNIGKCLKNYFDMSGEAENSHAEQRVSIDFRRESLKNPEQFNKIIVASAVELTVKNSLKDIVSMTQRKNYNRQDMKKALETLDKTTKIAREIGATNVLERVNKHLTADFKGATFDETLKKLQENVNKVNVRKQEEPAKGVRMK